MTQTINRTWILYPQAMVVQALTALEAKREQFWTHFNQQLKQGVDMGSRQGIEGAIWTILSVSLVAVLAVAVLFTLGPKLLQLGQNAVSKVQSPPW